MAHKSTLVRRRARESRVTAVGFVTSANVNPSMPQLKLRAPTRNWYNQ